MLRKLAIFANEPERPRVARFQQQHHRVGSDQREPRADIPRR